MTAYVMRRSNTLRGIETVATGELVDLVAMVFDTYENVHIERDSDNTECFDAFAFTGLNAYVITIEPTGA